MQLDLPQGISKVELVFAETWLRMVANSFSVFSFVALIVYFIVQYTYKKLHFQ
jgi:hypothetical protein